MAYLPLEDELVPELLPNLGPDERSARWHLVTPQLEDLTEGGGLVVLLNSLGPTRWLSRVMVQFRAERAVGWFSRQLSAHRGRLGRLVPDVEGPRRYP